MPRTRTLARTAVGATLLLIVLGGYTRGSASGYGCADRWPLCENGLLGGLLPRLEYHMMVEWTHRWVAALVGLLILATALAAWRDRPRSNRVLAPAALAVGAVGVQAWLGRMVVKGQLDPDLVTIHLTMSVVILVLLVTVAVAAGPARTERSPATAALLAGAVLLAYGVMFFGSLVHNLYFAGWPLVGGELVPDLSNRYVAWHWIHRLAAAVGLGAAGWLAVRLRHRPEAPWVQLAAWGFLVNVGLGLVHVLTKVTSGAVVGLHLGVSASVIASFAAAGAIALGWGNGPIESSPPAAAYPPT